MKTQRKKTREMDILDSSEPHEVRVAREEMNLLLAEQRKTLSVKVWR